MRIKRLSNNAVEGIDALLDTLIATGAPAQAVEIYNGRNRVVKLAMPSGDIVNIKIFQRPHIINRFAYGCLRASKAERAYRNAQRLIDMGFNSPTPLGFIEEHDGLMLGRSFYVSRQLEGYNDVRELHTYADKARLLEEIAKLMVNLHRKGVWVKDFSAVNILWKINDKGQYDLQLIDTNRMAFNVKSRDTLMLNFRNLFKHDDDLMELCRYYAKHSGRELEEVAADCRKAVAKFERKQRMKHKLR